MDRQKYRAMLRERIKPYRVSLLTYCITSNHTHLLLRMRDQQTESLSRFMQSLEGDFAQFYNRRKRRTGAFWSDRYHAVMIQDGHHLWRCLKYIDLNMVRAGVVEHPSEWEWTGYKELVGERRRNRLIDQDMLCRALGLEGQEGLELVRKQHRDSISEALAQRELRRQGIWTESVAVGERKWVEDIGGRIRNRMGVIIEQPDEEDLWRVKESGASYR